MNISKRESHLVLLTIAVILGAVSYLLGEAKWVDWKAMGEARAGLENEMVIDQRMLDQRDALEQELLELMSKLREFSATQQVTPQLMEAVNEQARSNGMNLPSQSPDSERELGDVYEVSLKCQFQGDLESLVRFLFGLQAEGANYNVRNLSVTPTGKGDELKGNVTVDCAYTRTDS